MEEFLLVDDDFCGNCSNSLNSTNLTSRNNSPKIYNLDIVVHTVTGNKALGVACEKVSVFTAIKDLLSCQFQISETDRVTTKDVNYSDNDHLNSANKSNEHSNVNVQVPLCLPCSLLLQDLYRSFKLFKSLRDSTSYISKLTHRIQQTFPIPDVRHINETGCGPKIQFDKYANNESEIQTLEDSFEDEFDVKVNPFERATGAHLSSTDRIVETGVSNSLNVQSSSFVSVDIPSATETNVKIETEVEAILENDFGLSVRTQEEMIEAAISDIAAEEINPLRSIECEQNSATNPLIQTATTTTKSAFYPGSSTHEESAFKNNESDDESYGNKLRRSGRFRSKYNQNSKRNQSLPSQNNGDQSAILTVSESSEDDCNSSDEIKIFYEANSSSQPTTSKSNLQKHPKNQIKIVNTYTINEAERKSETSNKEVRPSQKIQKPNFKCTFCPKLLYSQSGMTYHIASHTGERLYQCEFCEHKFFLMHSKRSHELTCNNRPDGLKIKPYNCRFCMRPFTQQSARAGHQRICQNRPDGLKVKLFNCVYCRRPFAQSSSKLSHERVCEQRPDGLKIKPYQCQFCRSKMFSKISGRLTHERACKMRPSIANPLQE